MDSGRRLGGMLNRWARTSFTGSSNSMDGERQVRGEAMDDSSGRNRRGDSPTNKIVGGGQNLRKQRGECSGRT